MTTDLRPIFERLAGEFLQAHPAIPHQWARTPDSSTLVVPPRSPTGFEVFATVCAASITVGISPGGFHDDYEYLAPQIPPEDFALSAFEGLTQFLRDDVRVREFRANNRPYAWQLELLGKDGWIRGESHSKFLASWFGKKTDHVLANDWLSAQTAA